jgi:hypothetical protein
MDSNTYRWMEIYHFHLAHWSGFVFFGWERERLKSLGEA